MSNTDLVAKIAELRQWEQIKSEAEQEAEEYECPECSTGITIDMSSCPNCGIGLSFEYEDDASAQDQSENK